MTRCATAAVRAASASMSVRRRFSKYARMNERQRENRNNRRQHEGQEQFAIEARADFAEQRPSHPRPLARQTREHGGADEHHDERGAAEGRQLRQVDEVIEPRQDRVADREDPVAIIREIDAVPDTARARLGPEWFPRSIQSLKEIVGDRPCRPPRGVERLETPAVNRHFHVRRQRVILILALGGAKDLEVRILRRDERQRLEIEDDVKNHRAEVDAAAAVGRRADSALGVEHAPLFGAERRDFAPRDPATARGALRRGSGVVRNIQGERADEFAFRVVQLDVRRQPLARQHRLLPHEERGIRRRHRRCASRDELRQFLKRVDLGAGFVQSRAKCFDMVLRLDRVLGDDQLADGALGEEIHRRMQQEGWNQKGEKERQNAGRDGRPAVPARKPRTDQCAKSARQRGQHQPERRDRPAAGRGHRRCDHGWCDPRRENEQSRPQRVPRHSAWRARGNQRQRRRPQRREMHRHDPRDEHEAREPDWIQRERAQVDRDWIRDDFDQPLNQQNQGRDANPGDELPNEQSWRSGSLDAAMPDDEPEPGRRAREQADEAGSGATGDQHRDRRGGEPPRSDRDGQPEKQARSGRKGKRCERSAHIHAAIASEATVEQGSDEQQDRDAEQRQHRRRDLTPPGRSSLTERDRIHPGLGERPARRRAQDDRTWPRTVRRAFDSKQRRRKRRLHPVFHGPDARPHLGRRQHVLGCHTPDPAIRGGRDRLDVHQPQAERRRRDQQRRWT